MNNPNRLLPLRRVLFLLILLVIVVVLGLATTARAVGFRLPNQDPEAIARGNAFAATADDPAAIYYNPAGITQLEGQNISAGMYFISSGYKFESSTSPSGATASVKSAFQEVPQLYYTWTPKDSAFSFGVGLYVPYGLGIDWGPTPPFRNVAMKGSLLYATFNPIVAYKVTDTLSLAVGPTFNYSRAEFTQGLGLGFSPDDQLHLVGDDTDFSFTAGALWKPTPHWSVGLNYRYQTTMAYRGHATAYVFPGFSVTSSSVKATLRFPQNVVLGVAFKPTTNWNVEADIDWTDWDRVNELNMQGLPLVPGGYQKLPLNYESGFMYELGVTRQLGKGWYGSLGYIYSENSIPERYFSPLIPDSNLHLGSFGFGHKGKRWDWALSYTLAINPGRVINSSVFGPSVSGDYHTANHAINLSANLKF